MRIYLLAIFLLLFSMSAAMADVQQFTSSGACNHFISEEWFTDRSMTVHEIQGFLNVKSPFLATYTENGLLAAQIIYNCANGLNGDSTGSAKGITIDANTGTVSPKAILLMLQVEQSLVTKTNPSQYSLDWAMGYVVGNNSYKGFATQVGWGAWQLRFNYEGALRGQSWWQSWYSSNPATWSYVGIEKTIGGYPLTYENAAVASFYRYLPSITSAYNFSEIGKEWFPETVPEPSSMLALGGSILGFLGLYWRRK